MRAGVVPWPPEVAADYRERGYWRGRALGTLPRVWAERFGGRVALVDGQVVLSYDELAVRVHAAARRLLGAGLRDGDNILVQLPNCHQFVVLVLACARIGVAPVLMLPAHRERDLVEAGRHTDAVALATAAAAKDFDLAAQARRVAARVPGIARLLVSEGRADAAELDLDALLWPGDGATPDPASGPDPADAALFLLSGGTTGTPKLIARTHNDYEYNFRRSAEVCRFDEDTVYLAALPAAHNFVLGSPGILGTLSVGGRVVLVRSPAPSTVLAAIERYRVTHTASVPTVLRRWVAHVCEHGGAAERSPDTSSLRFVQVGGERLEPELAVRAAELLRCGVQQVFGMAEGLLNYTRPDDPERIVLTTQGRPMSPGDEIKVVDEDGQPLAAGSPGELLTRGPYTPRGYFAAPEHNRESFTKDGWFRTGDLVCQDPDGNLSVVGRLKDIVNRGGEKISAAEIEGLIDELADVADVAVVPEPDPELGERVAAFVVPRAGTRLDLPGLTAQLRAAGVAAFKLPERLYLVDSLPQTAVGKTDKQALRRRLLEEGAARHRVARAGAANS